MNENELRGLMRGMAQPEPPLQLNAEDIMTEGRRRSRRKTAAAGLVAVGAIAAISLPVTIAAAGDDSGHTGGGPPAPVRQAPTQLAPAQTPVPSRSLPPTQLAPAQTPVPGRSLPPTQLAPAQTPVPGRSLPPTDAPTQLAPAQTPVPGRSLPPIAAPSTAPTQLAPPTDAPTRMAPMESPTQAPLTLAPAARPKLAPSTAPLVGTK